jgi:hypothetical protein
MQLQPSSCRERGN